MKNFMSALSRQNTPVPSPDQGKTQGRLRQDFRAELTPPGLQAKHGHG
jgi:hypothetical protein